MSETEKKVKNTEVTVPDITSGTVQKISVEDYDKQLNNFKSQNEIKGILDNPVESLSGGAIGVAAGFFKAANESVGSYGTTRNADGVATIYLMLK